MRMDWPVGTIMVGTCRIEHAMKSSMMRERESAAKVKSEELSAELALIRRQLSDKDHLVEMLRTELQATQSQLKVRHCASRGKPPLPPHTKS